MRLKLSLWSLLALLALYLVTAPSVLHHHWDSLEYAFACETPSVKQVWGNHPLGHVVLCGAFKAATRLGYHGRALFFMSGVNALIGALTVIALAALLIDLEISRRRAIGWAMVMAGLYGFWLYAATADVYALSLLAMLLAWRALLWAATAPTVRRAAIAGLVIGLAVVAHQFNGILLLVAFLGLVPFARGSRRPTLRALTALAGVSVVVVVAAYGAIGMWTTRSTGLSAIWPWIVGYGADPTYGRSFDLAGLETAYYSATQTLLRYPESRSLYPLRAGLLVLLVAPAILGLALLPFARGRLRPAVWSAWSQLGVGMPLVVWWAPYHIGKWWLLMLPALAVVQASGAETLAARLARLGPAAARRSDRLIDMSIWTLALACLAFTGVLTMRPMQRPNPAFDQAMAQWTTHTKPDDVIIQGDVTAHLLFWVKRPKALFLYRTVQSGAAKGDPFATLQELITRAHRDGRSVFFVPGTGDLLAVKDLALVGVTRDDLRAFFDRYARSGPVFRFRGAEGREEREVYLLGERKVGSRK
jgi:hypothetical protein